MSELHWVKESDPRYLCVDEETRIVGVVLRDGIAWGASDNDGFFDRFLDFEKAQEAVERAVKKAEYERLSTAEKCRFVEQSFHECFAQPLDALSELGITKTATVERAVNKTAFGEEKDRG